MQEPSGVAAGGFARTAVGRSGRVRLCAERGGAARDFRMCGSPPPIGAPPAFVPPPGGAWIGGLFAQATGNA